ncbi:DUF2550 family protein [Curtobacterium sp. VKM Ac-2887]|nr:DUF2550 family protein [Curtobacterium sp. VKM Ac-2887]
MDISAQAVVFAALSRQRATSRQAATDPRGRRRQTSAQARPGGPWRVGRARYAPRRVRWYQRDHLRTVTPDAQTRRASRPSARRPDDQPHRTGAPR